MKLSFIFFVLIVLVFVINFTKLSLWFPVKGYWALIFLVLGFISYFLEVHRENKKRRELVSEIRGGYGV
jgi:hypothetical protein